MGKFSENFYSSQIEEWKDSYIDYNILNQKMNNILNELSKYFKDTPGIPNRTESLNGKNIIKLDLESLYSEEPYGKYLKEFITLLDKEFKKVYVKYMSMEKELYTQINSHLYLEANLLNFPVNELKRELESLCLTIFLCKSLKKFINDNLNAMKRILTKFDNKFSFYFGYISYYYFCSKIGNQNSDLEYILQYKIIDETNALIEYLVEIILTILKNHRNQQEVKLLKSSVNMKIEEIMNYILKIDTDNKYQVKCKEWFYYIRSGDAIIKNKPENLKNDVYNPLMSLSLINDNLIEKLISDKANRKLNNTFHIKVSDTNFRNIIICLIHTFFVNYFYMHVINFIIMICWNKNKNNLNFYEFLLLWILVLLGKVTFSFVYNILEINKIKSSLIISTIFLLLGNIFSIIEINNRQFYDMVISRILIGMGTNSLISKNYFLQYVPKNSLPKVSLLHLIAEKSGFVIGTLIGFVFSYRFTKIQQFVLSGPISGWIGVLICIALLFSIVFCFHLPTNESIVMDVLEIDFLGMGRNASFIKDNVTPLLSTDEKKIIKDIDCKLNEYNEKNQFSDTNLIPAKLNKIIINQKKCSSYLNKSFTIILLLFILSSFFNEGAIFTFAGEISGDDEKLFYIIILFIGLIIELIVSVLIALMVSQNMHTLKFLVVCQFITIIFFLLSLILVNVENDENNKIIIKSIHTIVYICIFSSTSLIKVISSNLIANIMPPQWMVLGVSYGIIMYYCILLGQILGSIYGFIFLNYVYCIRSNDFIKGVIILVGPISYIILLLIINFYQGLLREKAITRILRYKLLNQLN